MRLISQKSATAVLRAMMIMAAIGLIGVGGFLLSTAIQAEAGGRQDVFTKISWNAPGILEGEAEAEATISADAKK